MKHILSLALTLLFVIHLQAQQQISLADWNKEAETNIRLLPKYGYAQKSPGQLKSDSILIFDCLKMDTTHRKASDHLVSNGFKYLYRDIKTAMYRFNQAYLLDSTNSDIYWGFGAVYLTLGDYARAKQQYEAGLALDPKSAHLLTDYATYFMAQYYALEPVMKEQAEKNLDSAIEYMAKSYAVNPKDQNTLYKFSICYWLKGDCDNAWKYYNECKDLGGTPIEESYTKDLKKKCKRK